MNSEILSKFLNNEKIDNTPTLVGTYQAIPIIYALGIMKDPINDIYKINILFSEKDKNGFPLIYLDYNGVLFYSEIGARYLYDNGKIIKKDNNIINKLPTLTYMKDYGIITDKPILMIHIRNGDEDLEYKFNLSYEDQFQIAIKKYFSLEKIEFWNIVEVSELLIRNKSRIMIYRCEREYDSDFLNLDFKSKLTKIKRINESIKEENLIKESLCLERNLNSAIDSSTYAWFILRNFVYEDTLRIGRMNNKII